MLDCEPAKLVPNPESATAEQINEERLSVAQWGVCNETKFHGLRTFIRGGKAPEPKLGGDRE